jgi:hypothetical protein
MHELRAQAHQLEELRDPLRARAPVPDPVHEKRLAHVVEDGHAGVQRAEGILEDHLHLRPQRPEFRGGQRRQVHDPAVPGPKPDLAASRRQGPQDAPGRRGLAAPALADEPEGRALLDLQAHVVDRPHLSDDAPGEALLDGEELLEMPDGEERRVRHVVSSTS